MTVIEMYTRMSAIPYELNQIVRLVTVSQPKGKKKHA